MLPHEHTTGTALIYQQLTELQQQFYSIWLSEMLFTWRWWVSVLLTIVPWLLWLRYRNPESKHRLLLAGFFSMIAALTLDTIGSIIGLWFYDYKALPLFPHYIPADFSIIPVAIMFMIQYNPSLNPHLKGLVFALLFSFIGEEILRWMALYELLLWRQYYSLPLYYTIFVGSHYFTTLDGFKPLKDT
ncbi:hypothetical protein GJ688_04835 [Heliobacillus mobilis]|uniref:Uncharacterized protein n=1 Tax=Heliobacterium mobile TaxID=28064 RepID=A0A6I3SHG4_HELMO|nr:CBO0543 family protein [Heliobacterium mobile]MTV48309.1 hypothetical protein [Heliobacterium mobile]